jgi:hypothetical protein
MRLRRRIHHLRQEISHKIDRKLNPPVTVSIAVFAPHMQEMRDGHVQIWKDNHREMVAMLIEVELPIIPRVGDTFSHLVDFQHDMYGRFTVIEVVIPMSYGHPMVTVQAHPTDFMTVVKTGSNEWRDATREERDMFYAHLEAEKA